MDGSVSGVQRMEYVCGGTDGGQNTGGKPGARKPQRSGQKAGASDGNFNRKEERIPTGIGELDRVLGGGIVPGSLTLVGGDPGIGRSTLLLQVCRMLSQQDIRFYTFPARSPCARSNCAPCGSENLMKICLAL